MGILYNVPDLKTWGIMFFILVVLIALNELGRETKWGGILLFGDCSGCADNLCMADNLCAGK